jgi:hypothetical protein
MCPTFTAGRIGMAADFDGAQYLVVPHHADFDLPAAQTVALWFRLRTVVTTEPMIMFSKPQDPDIANTWLLGTRDPAGQLLFAKRDTDGANRRAIGMTTPTVDRWTHLAGTVSTDGVMRLYVDGTVEATLTTGTTAIGTFDVLIGAELEFDSIAFFVDGLIDDVRVYDRELTSAEILDLAMP